MQSFRTYAVFAWLVIAASLLIGGFGIFSIVEWLHASRLLKAFLLVVAVVAMIEISNYSETLFKKAKEHKNSLRKEGF